MVNIHVDNIEKYMGYYTTYYSLKFIVRIVNYIHILYDSHIIIKLLNNP